MNPWLTALTVIFSANILILSMLLYRYLSYRKRQIPHMGKSLAFICVCILQSCLAFACLALPESAALYRIVMINVVFGTLMNTLLVQVMLCMMGYNGPRAKRALRVLYLLPVLSAVLALTNGLHHKYVAGVTKLSDGVGYVIETGELGYALGALSSGMIAMMFLLIFWAERRTGYKNLKTTLVVLAAVLVPSLVNTAEHMLEGSGGSNYRLYIFTMFITVAAIYHVYYGYLGTARSKALQLTEDVYLLFDKWGSLVDVNTKGEAFFREYGLGPRPAFKELEALIGTTYDAGLPGRAFSLAAGGGARYYTATNFGISDSISQYCGSGFIIREVTAYQERMNQLNTIAHEDELTGVKNRRYFNDLAPDLLHRAKLERRPLTLLMMDLDHFKRINDTYGHSVGDEILQAVCHVCQKNLRKGDILFRYGGEEFIILSESTEREVGVRIAERIVRAIGSQPFTTSAGEIAVTVSIGGCTFVPGKEDLIEDWVDTADRQLYIAKEAGRNRVAYEINR